MTFSVDFWQIRFQLRKFPAAPERLLPPPLILEVHNVMSNERDRSQLLLADFTPILKSGLCSFSFGSFVLVFYFQEEKGNALT